MKIELAPKKNGGPAVPGKGYRIMLVDDHPVMREGLAQLINHESDFSVCGQYEDAAQAFAAIGRRRRIVTFVHQDAAEHVPNRGIIVHDQDAFSFQRAAG